MIILSVSYFNRKNCPPAELLNTVQIMENGWRKLTNKSKGNKFRKICLGSFRTLEITRNPINGYYHPHFHIIVVVRKSYFKSRDYLNQKDFTKLWSDCCGLDYDPICHIEKVKKYR